MGTWNFYVFRGLKVFNVNVDIKLQLKFICVKIVLDLILSNAKSYDVAFLVVGDPLG